MQEDNKPNSVRFSRTRKHHANETAEDYVEAVAEIIGASGECRVLDLAKYFDVSHVTVSRIVKRLQGEDLLVTRPYRPISLTKQGAKMARHAKQLRHEIVPRVFGRHRCRQLRLPRSIARASSIMSARKPSLQ
jgi:DtxR family manganese transport transcriptional regulator